MIDRSKLPNSFEFVVTAGARARQLLAGSTPRVDVGRAQEDHRRAEGSAHASGRKSRPPPPRPTEPAGELSGTRIRMLIALGVTGGIGAYKAVEVARGLQKRGHEVVAIMTHSATRFVGPVTFEAITRRRVITDQFGSRARTPTSSTSRWPRPSICCSSRRPPPTSSASSPTASPTISCRRCTRRRARRC